MSRQKAVLISVMLTSFLTPFMGTAVSLAIPSIGMEFGGGAEALSWLVTVYLLSSAVLLLPMGRFADIFGRKKIYTVGIWLFTVFTILSGLSWSLSSMVFFRFCQGAACSLIFSTGIAMLTSVFPPEKRGYALGLTSAAVYTGLSLGPVLGGAMTHYLGWRSIFHLTAAVGALAGAVTAWNVRDEWADARGEVFDWSGSILYVAALAMFLYGLSALRDDAFGRYTFCSGVILLGAFWFVEAKRSSPILNVKVFSRNRAFVFANVASLLNYSATFATTFIMSIYFQIVLKIDPDVAGLILLSQPLMMVVISPFAGRLSDRVEPRLVSSCGMGISTVGFSACAFVTTATPVWLVAAVLAVIGVGFALFISPNTNSIMGAVDKSLYGVAASSLATMRLVGQAISMAVITLLLSIHAEAGASLQGSAYSIEASTRSGFMVFAGICAAGLLASVAAGKRKERSGS
jgi:EmrB/QacA subfamily drug resistance transporter